GFPSQTIEVGDVRFLNYKNTLALEDLPITEITYIGQAPDASWRIPAEERINQIRKGLIDIIVYDDLGQLLQDAAITVEMVKHQFGFGTAIAASALNSDAVYRNKVMEMFNEVVFENDLKWPQFNPYVSNDHITRALDTLQVHQIGVRGHNVIWPSFRFCPPYLESLSDDPSALRNAVDQHIDDVTGFTKDRLIDWDVMNEPYSEHDLQNILGDEVMADWFKRVRRNDRGVKLYINDYSILSAGGKNKDHQDYYYDVIEYIDNLGGEIEGIGMQGHFSNELTSIDKVYEILERFAVLGKEIKITEHDIDLTQRNVQADYTRDFMTIVFSHPSAKSFLIWGFWAGRHWKPESAFFDLDWNIRPHGEVWNDLIYNQWWTPAINAVSDDQGMASFEGCLGTYKYTVTS
ncbi:MAG: endo-1,4-beta-xylanase, partial [Bacteroidales bacterium]|nr:endo-1,4-beta-xylanase [Bacteroidales bacterium]